MGCMSVLNVRKAICNSNWQTPTQRKYALSFKGKEIFKLYML